MWKLKETAEGNTAEENAVLMKKKLEDLKNQIPQIQKIEVGISYRHEKEDLDIILITQFATKYELEEYQHHKAHEPVNEFIKKVKAERYCVDFKSTKK